MNIVDNNFKPVKPRLIDFYQLFECISLETSIFVYLHSGIDRRSNLSIWEIKASLIHCYTLTDNGIEKDAGVGAGGRVRNTQLKREKIFRNNDMKQISSSSISTCLLLWHLSEFIHPKANWIIILHWISYCRAVFGLKHPPKYN